jgi:hypothetical protein
VTFGAKHLHPETVARLGALARQRTPAWAREQLAAQEAMFAEEAAIRKQQSQSNALRWYAVRKARGAAK